VKPKTSIGLEEIVSCSSDEELGHLASLQGQTDFMWLPCDTRQDANKVRQLRTVVAKSGLNSPAYISGLAWLMQVPFGYDIPLLAVYYP
jgi:hypothetical protein